MEKNVTLTHFFRVKLIWLVTGHVLREAERGEPAIDGCLYDLFESAFGMVAELSRVTVV